MSILRKKVGITVPVIGAAIAPFSLPSMLMLYSIIYVKKYINSFL
ncbi:hypothetical protein [Ammoniphilus sp. CFH 90114]|nr:hypothetical protein EIZ39_25255 [Ammoniphilus sp. CFH 90114]